MYIKQIKKIPAEIYIFLLAFLYRLPLLGYDFINNDAYLWKERGYAFGSALTSLDFAGTAVTYHPGVTLLWSQFIAIKIYSLLNSFVWHDMLGPKEEWLINHQIQKIVLVFFTSVLISVLYWGLKKIIGRKASIVAVILVLFEPFYLGLSRALHLDVLMALFMFIAFIFVYRSIAFDVKFTFKSKNIILGGVFTGFALLTKSAALFLLPFFVLLGFLFYLRERRIEIIKKILTIFFYAAAVFFILWPAMWVDPIASVQSYIFDGIAGVGLEEGHGHIWFGEVTQDPGSLFYPVVLIGRYSFILFSLSIIGVGYLFWKKKIDLSFLKKREGFVYLSLLYMICFLLMITLTSKKLDRYSIPITFSMAVISGYYLVEVLKRKALAYLLVFFILSRIVLLYGFHPNYLAYYSPLIGGAENGKNIIEPKWLIGYDKVAAYFNEKQKESSDPLKVAIADFDYLRPFADFEVLNIKNKVERDKADFFVLPVYRQERNDFYEKGYTLQEEEDRIVIVGVDYYVIYKKLDKK